MAKKTHILLVLYFFCSFTLLVWGEKNILTNLTKSQEPRPLFFGPLKQEPEPLEKKPGAGAAWENNQEPEPHEKKSGAEAAKISRLPGPVIKYNYFPDRQ